MARFAKYAFVKAGEGDVENVCVVRLESELRHITTGHIASEVNIRGVVAGAGGGQQNRAVVSAKSVSVARPVGRREGDRGNEGAQVLAVRRPVAQPIR